MRVCVCVCVYWFGCVHMSLSQCAGTGYGMSSLYLFTGSPFLLGISKMHPDN